MQGNMIMNDCIQHEKYDTKYNKVNANKVWSFNVKKLWISSWIKAWHSFDTRRPAFCHRWHHPSLHQVESEQNNFVYVMIKSWIECSIPAWPWPGCSAGCCCRCWAGSRASWWRSPGTRPPRRRSPRWGSQWARSRLRRPRWGWTPRPAPPGRRQRPGCRPETRSPARPGGS